MWRPFRTAVVIADDAFVRSMKFGKIRPQFEKLKGHFSQRDIHILRELLGCCFFKKNCAFIVHQAELHCQFHCLLCYNDNKFFLEHARAQRKGLK